MKQLILILIILTAGYVCHAQLRPPVQTDTLEIISVKYNYMDIDKENWPCRFIYKSTTGFNICGQEFKIVDVASGFLAIEFTLSDASVQNGKLTVHAEHAEMLKSLADQIYAIL